MGSIIRVRGRLRSLHTLPKLDEKVRDEKIAETVCLLSVLFLLPYCSKGHSPLLLSLGGWCVTTYTFLVLPLLISANYKYPVRWLRRITSNVPGCCIAMLCLLKKVLHQHIDKRLLFFSLGHVVFFSNLGAWTKIGFFLVHLFNFVYACCEDLSRKYSKPVWNFICKIYSPIHRCENMFMKMTNISTLATQLVFFIMCDRVLLCSFGGTNCPQKKITGLFSLMFYNVIAYCTSYIKELIEKEDWSVTVRMTQHSNIKHVAMTATKIVLEWTKAVCFIITVTFMLLVFGLEQGLEHYQPTALYTFITWTYYMCTEKVFVDLFLHLLVSLKIKSLEALEPLYAPVFLRYYTITLATILVTFLSFYGNNRITFVSFYLTVYLKTKDMVLNCLRALKQEQAVLGQFRNATAEEIENCDDVCAVCLNHMERARVTPCQHMFHAVCLRQCLYNSNNCPICKREYVFVHN